MILEVIILILAFPVGYLIAYWTRDELIQGRKWFKMIIIASILGGFWFFIIGEDYISLTLIFILISTFISYLKSHDKKWTKKRIWYSRWTFAYFYFVKIRVFKRFSRLSTDWISHFYHYHAIINSWAVEQKINEDIDNCGGYIENCVS